MALDHTTPATVTIGTPITLDEAKSWTNLYQKSHQNELRAVYFSSDVFQTLLKQAGTQGIRIYLANDGTKDTMVLVSATGNADLTGPEYQIFDHGGAIPPGQITSLLNQ